MTTYSAIAAAGAAKTDVGSATASAVLSASPSRTYVEIQSQATVAIRVAVGQTATASVGYRVLPGETWWTERHAAAAISVIAESGSGHTIYMSPASEV